MKNLIEILKAESYCQFIVYSILMLTKFNRIKRLKIVFGKYDFTPYFNIHGACCYHELISPNGLK